MDTLDYKVRLDQYYGPLDLLLYLVKESEVDIQNIPLARVTEQYLLYIEALQKLDLDLAGDFLVMASSLMEIKARLLVPRPETEEGEEEEDPRRALIEKLLEFKRFKDLAGAIGKLAERRAARFGRPRVRPPGMDSVPTEEIAVELALWDLAAAFARILRETALDVPRTILFDQVPIEQFMAGILERLAARGEILFSELVGDRNDRGRVVAHFIATLELARQRQLTVEQSADLGDLHLRRRADAPPLAPLSETLIPSPAPAAAPASTAPGTPQE